MPSGKIHAALTMSVASGMVAPYVAKVGGDPLSYAIGCLMGVVITPDLDVDGGMYSDTILRKVFRPLQWAWRVFWFPYALLIPHRHPISHFPLLGTAIRIGYIYFIINLCLWLLGFPAVFWWDWSVYFGLCHADIIHFATDMTIKGSQTLEDYVTEKQATTSHRRRGSVRTASRHRGVTRTHQPSQFPKVSARSGQQRERR